MAESSKEPADPAAPPIRVLIVDNDTALAQAMEESLARVGYHCTIATSGPEGVRRVQQDNFEIVITDLVMNDVDGMEVLARAKEALPEAEVIMVTGHATVPKAVEAMQQGAFNFLEKPITPTRLRAVAEKAADAVRLRQTNQELNQRLDERFGFEGIIFSSEKMKQVIDRLKRIAPTDASVLITGESGTGKELVAQAIHQNSPRKSKRIVALNCAAVAENLVESELFGHVKGAYTDALNDRMGAFEYANGGTLFLDEVGDMPLATQIKLLRVLEEHQITRVGDNKPIRVNVRMVSATNRALEDAIKAGTFRADLYYRLKVVTVELPALRQRREDIVPLADHFRRQFIRRHHKPNKGISPVVSRRLFSYDWPGNVRQLRNAIETMVVLDTDGILDIDDLPPELVDAEELRTPAIASGPSELIGQPLDNIERWAIEETLKLTSGNREEAARILGIGARTLYRKLDKYQSGEASASDVATDE
ncbi:two component, sigma54 specific, transcriptional regulator, Fis family [Pirellula staleyi DSM 6068]|uniref:Two component, sigma54 specific, transcriptional regulator, Fis family n=1 Tax=Pirellula staleyi (strain ATCC 27377 / DSM 6068 / ICPB 4128) TaxID=530564 RepID=D2R262_PIRSD|nr:sigma-54 dependent transcriptional regulator [Pirellula staleyi]ADB18673.1 two component, sigma54 specific, transcriptional regulator, Fis family [Pirellula staleyi DSM 6068]